MAAQRAALNRPIDVLVGTPARVVQHAAKGNLFYGDIEFVVLDEADTMMDRGFGPEVLEILKAVRTKAVPARCVLVSATMTKPIRALVATEFPGMRTLETSSLHKGVVGARHAFLPVPGTSDKLEHLLQVVEGEQKRGKRVMIFCNTLDSCRAADYFLRERSLPQRATTAMFLWKNVDTRLNRFQRSQRRVSRRRCLCARIWRRGGWTSRVKWTTL